MAEESQRTNTPKLLLIFSGKRKSGKDYITDKLQQRLGSASVIVRLSGPLKYLYAKEHGLDFAKLTDSSPYKERHRLDMIKWSEEIRKRDHGYFCLQAIDQYGAWAKAVWIISDARRMSDIAFFKQKFGHLAKTVRVEASDSSRAGRGWAPTTGVDDAESECGLDNFHPWDFVVRNDGAPEDVEKFVHEVQTIFNETN